MESECREKYRLFMYHISATRTLRVKVNRESIKVQVIP